MERLTWRLGNGEADCNQSKDACFALHSGGGEGCWGCEFFPKIIERLAAIEDILGDTYDLDHLRELVGADKDGQCVVLPSHEAAEAALAKEAK